MAVASSDGLTHLGRRTQGAPPNISTHSLWLGSWLVLPLGLKWGMKVMRVRAQEMDPDTQVSSHC